MDCAAFEELVLERLEGRSPAGATVSAMRAHAAACERCRALESLLDPEESRLNAVATVVELPDDLAASIIGRTSGGACGRARHLLAARFDGPLLEQDEPLLAMHVASCTSCARFEIALRRLRRELPTIAELEPDRAFVADVLAATVGGPVSAATRLRRRVARTWERLAQRPRLALEGAYAFALAVFLVVGLPSPSLSELPARAFGEIRQGSGTIERAVTAGLGEIADASRQALAESAQRVSALVESSMTLPGALSAEEDAATSWLRSGRGLIDGFWGRVLEPVIELFRSLWRAAPPDASEAATAGPGDSSRSARQAARDSARSRTGRATRCSINSQSESPNTRKVA